MSDPIEVSDLTLFQLCALREVIDQEPTYGLDVKRALEDFYGSEINHGRLYPNLDDLEQMGLIEKRERDGRTNDLLPTENGRRVIAALAGWFDVGGKGGE